MFKLVYLKLRSIYKQLSELYASLAVAKPFNLIVLYLILTSFLSVWIIQIKFTSDNESLTIIKNSEVLHNQKLIDAQFPQNQTHRYFQHQLTTLGFYAEVIIRLKQFANDHNYSNYKQNNLLNQTYLNEYNKFYDNLLNLTIEGDDGATLKYTDLCPKRLNKPAVEGSILRHKTFQQKLLKHEIGFSKEDLGAIIIDGDLKDGTSVNFVFGKLCKYKCIADKSTSSSNCVVTHFGQIRNRFDLLSSSPMQKQLSIKFMHKFADYMSNLKSDYFEFSFHTSHTLETEIYKYSIFDLKYVYFMFMAFWICYFCLMCIDFDYVSMSSILNGIRAFRRPGGDSRASRFRMWFLRFISVLYNGSGFLALVTFTQFLITIISTLGVMSFLDVAINQLLYTVIFVLMINSCHQSFLLYKNFKRIETKSEEELNNCLSSSYYKLNQLADEKSAEDTISTINNLHMQHNFAKLIHKIMIPNFFSLLTAILSYMLIGLTSAFDAVSIYCLFLSVCLSINFLGQILFYCPCLILHMKLITSNKNYFLCCIYKPQQLRQLNDKPKELASSPSPKLIKKQPSTESLLTEEKSVSQPNKPTTAPAPPQPTNTAFENFIEHFSAHKFNFVFNTKFKYLVLAVFVCYFFANIFVCAFNLKIDIPVTDLLPARSYLAKHMANHQNDFELGPMIVFNFMEPVNYSDAAYFKKMNAFLDDVKSFKGMRRFELNWYAESMFGYKEALTYNLDDPAKYAIDYVIGQENYADDLNLSIENSNILIKSHRIYIQMDKFTGSSEEVDLMNDIQYLAEDKYQYSKQQLIIFSSVYIFLEQLNEIFPSIIALISLPMECVFVVSLFLMFDLKSIFIQSVIFVSLILSIFSNLYIFKISLNIVTLFQLIMIPSLLIEFLLYTGHLFLLKTPSDLSKKKNKPPITKTIPTVISGGGSDEAYAKSSGTSSSLESLELIQNNTKELVQVAAIPEVNKKHQHHKRLRFVLGKNLNLTSLFLVFICTFSFSIMSFCDTYNFHTLYLVLMIACLNTFVHVYIFYPNLLGLFGTCWTQKQQGQHVPDEDVNQKI